MEQDQLSYSDLVMRESRRHRGTLLSQPLSDCKRQTMETQAANSLDDQAAAEAADTQGFDHFLADYMAQ